MGYAQICLIKKDNKGFTCLTLCNPNVFKKHFITFCIWNLDDLKHEGQQMMVHDIVDLKYQTNGKFPVLTTMKPAPADILTCRLCFMHYTPKTIATRSAQNCPYCLGLTRPKNILQDRFLLVQKSVRKFKFSKGLCLKFRYENQIICTTVFANSPFHKMRFIKGKYYNVTAWVTKSIQNLQIVELFDVKY